MTLVGWRQLLKETRCFRIRLQRFGDAGRQVRDCRSRRVCVRGWRCCQPGRGEEANPLEFRPAFAIDVRPLAGGLSRRELARVPIVIEAFDEAVDPSEA